MSTVGTWFEKRSFHHTSYADIAALARSKAELGRSVTVVLPTRNVADTIGPIIGEIQALNAHDAPLVDEILVVDADSPDGTAGLAAEHGATVYSENSLMPAFGPCCGKGDAMWRSLSVAQSDIVMFADSDTKDFPNHFISGVLGALLLEPDVAYVKAGYRRPLVQGGKSVADGGGRVTELMAKPLLNLLYPQLAGFVQPLAGEFAASRELFRSIPFFTGYGVEAGIMIDALDELGLDALAQVDLGERLNRHQELAALGEMSHSILRAVLQRASGRVAGPHPVESVFAGTMLRYFHAVSSPEGFQLEEYAEPLFERPPMSVALANHNTRR
jgi:glucosyl-3-phosphoglycerate synthase